MRVRVVFLLSLLLGITITIVSVVIASTARDTAEQRALEERGQQLERSLESVWSEGVKTLQQASGAVIATDGDPEALRRDLEDAPDTFYSAALIRLDPPAVVARVGESHYSDDNLIEAARELDAGAAAKLGNFGLRFEVLGGDGLELSTGRHLLLVDSHVEFTPELRNLLSQVWVIVRTGEGDQATTLFSTVANPPESARRTELHVYNADVPVTLIVGSSKPLATGPVRILPELIGVCGLLLTALIGFALLGADRHRRRLHVLEIEKAKLDLVLATQPSTIAELSANADRYQRILANAPDVFVIFDFTTRDLTFLNRREFLGYPLGGGHSDSINRLNEDQLLAMIHRDDASALQGVVNELGSASGYRVVESEVRVRAVKGDWEWVRVRFAPVDATAGKPVRHLVGVLTVVTYQRRQAERREQLERQLRQAQRLEAVGQLAGGVAHDLNNVLAAVMSLAELASLEVEGTTAADDLAEIRKATKRGADLLRQLLIFSRRDVSTPMAVDANEVIRGLDNLLTRTLSRQVELRLRLSDDLPAVRADQAELEQAITNLAVNARDAMAGKGILTIETSVVEIDAAYADLHPNARPGTFVRLSVSDTGEGMDAEVRSRIFEPFFTTKEIGAGTGLGLAMVYGMVTGLGGHVEVYSELGNGTAFKLYLPLADQPVAPAVVSPLRRVKLGNGERLLLVDDETAVREANARILRRAGYSVVTAPDGPSALAVPELALFDVAVVDMVMPGGLDGMQTVDRMRQVSPGLPVVFVSGFSAEVLRGRGLDDTSSVLLEKPFAANDLLRTVANALAQRETIPSFLAATAEDADAQRANIAAARPQPGQPGRPNQSSQPGRPSQQGRPVPGAAAAPRPAPGPGPGSVRTTRTPMEPPQRVASPRRPGPAAGPGIAGPTPTDRSGAPAAPAPTAKQPPEGDPGRRPAGGATPQ